MIKRNKIVPMIEPITENITPKAPIKINIKIRAVKQTIIDVVIPVIPNSFAELNIVLYSVVPLRASAAILNKPVTNNAPINAAIK